MLFNHKIQKDIETRWRLGRTIHVSQHRVYPLYKQSLYVLSKNPFLCQAQCQLIGVWVVNQKGETWHLNGEFPCEDKIPSLGALKNKEAIL